MPNKKGIKNDRLNIGARLQTYPTVKPPPQQLKPKFSLEYLQSNYCISKCDTKERADFANTLRKLGQLTWNQIKSSGKHQLGYEIIPRYKIRVFIPPHISEDVDLIAFRFSGKKSMVGYRESEVLYLLWFDPKFKLYKHS